MAIQYESEIQESVKKAVERFLQIRKNKGRETAVKGNALDELSLVIRDIILDANPELIVDMGRKACIPGFFRPSKNWDLIVKTLQGNTIIVIELKSLTRSHGNNFNNRVEECIGNAFDLQMYYQSINKKRPFIGYLMLINNDLTTTSIKKNQSKNTLKMYKNTSYLERARLLCQNVMKSNLYNHAGLIEYTVNEQIQINTKDFVEFIEKIISQVKMPQMDRDCKNNF